MGSQSREGNELLIEHSDLMNRRERPNLRIFDATVTTNLAEELATASHPR